MAYTRNVAQEVLFKRELTELINKYNFEADSNTPDFLLADIMFQALVNFESGTLKREQYYGKSLKPEHL